MKKSRATVPLAVGLLLAGCSTAPSHQRPALVVPAAFKEATPLAADLGVWQTARHGGASEDGLAPSAIIPSAWWTLYGDTTLNQLQDQAAITSPSVEQAVARLRAAQAAVASSRAGLFPTLGASGSGNRARNASSSNASAGAGINSSYSLGLNASWELDLWGRLSGQVDASQLSAQASQDDLAAARLSSQATLAQTYFSLRAAEAQVQLLQDSLQVYLQSWELTQNRYRAGVVSSADVAQAEAQYKTTQVQLLEAQTTRTQFEHALAALQGQAPALFSLPVTGQLPAPPQVPGLLASTLLEQRPDIAAAERRMAAANAQVGVARAAYFPALTLSAAGGYRSSTLSSLLSAPNLFWSLGPGLALALFDGGARTAAVESARAALDLAGATYKQTVLTALQEVEDNLVAATHLAQEQQIQAEAVAAAQKALTVVSNQYKAGTVAYLNVLSAQTTVLSAQNSLVSVQNRRLAAINTLLKNVAGRWEPLQAQAASAQTRMAE
ncbi:efflux transporter outer membrane subunit [Acidovorax sp. Be4]|uniref:Efflux transporter outer membrane subunit n=1 Tax=Acidovorax bellezanensis TaxID=2976702 RepID=A0ABT2PPH5_9BURK|nr:efflux transporter outer membrane subunit [Acidovorax sp. Be4]